MRSENRSVPKPVFWPLRYRDHRADAISERQYIEVVGRPLAFERERVPLSAAAECAAGAFDGVAVMPWRGDDVGFGAIRFRKLPARADAVDGREIADLLE